MITIIHTSEKNIWPSSIKLLYCNYISLHGDVMTSLTRTKGIRVSSERLSDEKVSSFLGDMIESGVLKSVEKD